MYKSMLTKLVFGSVSDILPHGLSVVVLTALRDGVVKLPLCCTWRTGRIVCKEMHDEY